MDRRHREQRTSARQLRALRGSAAASVSTTIAATAHTLAGGGAPPWWLLVAVAVLTSPLAVWLVGHRPTVRGTAAAVVLAQIALHAAFATVGTSGPQSATAHHGAATQLTAAGSLSTGHLHLDAGMIAAHLAAAAITVVLLAHGERLLGVLARGIRRLLRPLLAVLTVPTLRASAPVDAPVTIASVFLSALSRRGPPAFAR